MIRTILLDLRASRLRVTLTALSMLLGVLAVVGVAVGGVIGRDAFVGQAEQESGRAVTFAQNFQVAANNVDRLPALASALGQRTVNSDTRTMVSVTGSTPVTLRSTPSALNIAWSSTDSGNFFRRPLLEGNSLYFGGRLPRGTTLNQPARTQLGIDVGGTFQVSCPGSGSRAVFTVSGIVDDGASDPNGYSALPQILDVCPAALVGANAEMRVQSATLAESAATGVMADSLHYTRFAPQGDVRRADTVDQLEKSIGILSTVFLVAGVALLLVSGIGILNVGLASVRERARELVVRRAMGASKGHIFIQVMGGAVVVGLGVGALGTVLAVAATYALPGLLSANASIVQAPDFPWWACAVALGAALLTTIAGNLAPAVKATRLPVASALRE